MSLSSNFPTSVPTLNLDFANVGALDPRITFTRATTATYTNSLGLIATAASGVARFDYDPTTLAPRGLLIEEARTNLLTYSEQFDNAVWEKSDTTVTANAIAAPNGTITADKLNETATTTNHQLYSSISASAQSYTWSIYARASERTVFSLGFSGATARYAWFDLSSGTLVSATNCTATITNVGNSWYRCTLTATAAAETTYPQIFLGTTASGYAPSYAGTAGFGIYLWGAQLEAGSFATSYIPTVASTVTRNADVASMTSLTPWFAAGAGTYFVESRSVAAVANNTQIAMSAGATYGAGNGLLLRHNPTAVQFGGNSSSVTSQAITPTSVIKAAGAYQGVNAKLAVNGGTVGSMGTMDFTGSGTTTLLFGALTTGGSQQGNTWISRVAFYPSYLSDAQLQALTS